MSWINKFQVTRDASEQNPRLGIVFDSAGPASEVFLASLKERYSFIAEEYLTFLRQSDGAQIWMYVLAGSGESTFPSIDRLIERWNANLGTAALIVPIGEDPSGSCLALTEDGRVVLLDFKMDSPDEAEAIATSFDEFLDKVLMGNKYPSLFIGGLTPDHENEWTEYLREQGWLESR